MANIDSFKANLLGGGARANQFFVQLSFPQYVAAGPALSAKGQFVCKGAQLPASTIDNTPVNFRGRQVNLAGERTFENWQVTVYNDTNFNIRNAFALQNSSAIKGKQIVLVDDVMTTGHTLNELAHCLKRHGALRVINLVVARTPIR